MITIYLNLKIVLNNTNKLFDLVSICLSVCLSSVCLSVISVSVHPSVFQDRVSLCNSHGCSGTHSVDWAGFELTDLHLPLPPEYRGTVKGTHAPPYPNYYFILCL